MASCPVWPHFYGVSWSMGADVWGRRSPSAGRGSGGHAAAHPPSCSPAGTTSRAAPCALSIGGAMSRLPDQPCSVHMSQIWEETDRHGGMVLLQMLPLCSWTRHQLKESLSYPNNYQDRTCWRCERNSLSHVRRVAVATTMCRVYAAPCMNNGRDAGTHRKEVLCNRLIVW